MGEEGKVGKEGEERQRADFGISPETLDIEEVNYTDYVKGVQRVMTYCMGDALMAIQEGIDEAQEGLNESIGSADSVEAEDTIKFWDLMNHTMRNILPLSIMRTKNPLSIITVHEQVMGNIRIWMRKVTKEEKDKAKFYHQKKQDIYFWDPGGEANPVDLFNQHMGNQQQAMQAQQGQPQSVAPTNDPMIM